MISRKNGDSEADVSLCASLSGPCNSARQAASETAGQNVHTVTNKNGVTIPPRVQRSQSSVDKDYSFGESAGLAPMPLGLKT